ncbi:hypothetical protein MMC25_000437 [Agyrium rufum]|nr:hypothetical protein [Agyrium rufum]
MSKKRTLDGFFQSSSPKRARISPERELKAKTSHVILNSLDAPTDWSDHPTYPYPVPHFPKQLQDALTEVPASEGKDINDQLDLDLLYFQPYIPKSLENELFQFLRRELFFYRVQYKIKRGPTETMINTPRYTTVFGVDATSFFDPKDPTIIRETHSSKPVLSSKYACKPRPLPHCLDSLRQITEIFTNSTYNFCLVNYYANGNDSISYHSDDERFLGENPAIASFSLGAKRDFLMRHKPYPLNGSSKPNTKASKNADGEALPSLKLTLASGDMVLMRGTTQSTWLHSIPKRKGPEAGKGRINITFRKALVKGGTENYYQYNVGSGGVWKWDDRKGEMREWKKGDGDAKEERMS